MRNFQGAKARLDVVPMPENLVNDVVDDEDSQRTACDQEPLHDPIHDTNGKLQEEIQTYEKRIHGLIEGVGMLKERVRKVMGSERTNYFPRSRRLVIRTITINCDLTSNRRWPTSNDLTRRSLINLH